MPKKAVATTKVRNKYQGTINKLYQVETRYLIETWLELMDAKESQQDFFECLRYVWTATEGNSNSKSFFLMMFSSPHDGREEWLMDKQEAAFLKNLPDIVPIYRGCSVNKVNGLSWTTDKEKAIWFGNRFNFGSKEKPFDKACCVVTGQIAKTDILGVFHSRDEFEIVCDPKNVKRRVKEILPPIKG